MAEEGVTADRAGTVDVVLVGVIPGQGQGMVAARLAGLLGIPDSQASTLLMKAPVAIKRGVSAAEGDIYLRKLAAVGAEVLVRPSRAELSVDGVAAGTGEGAGSNSNWAASLVRQLKDDRTKVVFKVAAFVALLQLLLGAITTPVKMWAALTSMAKPFGYQDMVIGRIALGAKWGISDALLCFVLISVLGLAARYFGAGGNAGISKQKIIKTVGIALLLSYPLSEVFGMGSFYEGTSMSSTYGFGYLEVFLAALLVQWAIISGSERHILPVGLVCYLILIAFVALEIRSSVGMVNSFVKLTLTMSGLDEDLGLEWATSAPAIVLYLVIPAFSFLSFLYLPRRLAMKNGVVRNG